MTEEKENQSGCLLSSPTPRVDLSSLGCPPHSRAVIFGSIFKFRLNCIHVSLLQPLRCSFPGNEPTRGGQEGEDNGEHGCQRTEKVIRYIKKEGREDGGTK